VLLCFVQRACYKHSPSIQLLIKNDVTKIEKTLAADDMQGRRAFTPGIDKLPFIESEFKKIAYKL
jgi:hypothetical protein